MWESLTIMMMLMLMMILMMKVLELQDLRHQAAEQIMKSPEAKRLNVMADIAKDFPSHTRSLSRVTVGKEVKKNSDVQVLGDLFDSLDLEQSEDTQKIEITIVFDGFFFIVQPSDAALFVNALHYDMDYAAGGADAGRARPDRTGTQASICPDGAGPVRQDGDLRRGREGQRSQLGQQHRGGQDVQDLARQRTGDTPARLPRGMLRSIR